MNYDDLLRSIDAIDPIAYGKSRNFTDGAVTRLSPYISRGVLDLPVIVQSLVNRGFSYNHVQKFVQQMAWREFFQRVWQTEGDRIHQDLRNDQRVRFKEGIPKSVDGCTTGIDAIDKSIVVLKESGYMHNHVRMYLAFLACNLAGFHWRDPARWMYYHLLDGDWASNALSWQWVAGTFSNKQYIANQENINYYAKSNQRNTYLDCSYEELERLTPSRHLLEVQTLHLNTNLPSTNTLVIDAKLPTCIYNYYNLSPVWRKDEKANRVLLLEPTLFEQYPISELCMAFMMKIATQIPGLQVFVGSFDALQKLTGPSTLNFREHPLNRHYQGVEEPREWMIQVTQPVKGSFFSFWKKYEWQLQQKFSMRKT
jgi:deoxyribodipyrimidine photo-lyase